MTSTDLHVHITWDTEPTEQAKAFVQAEVLRVLKETFEERSWFAELVRGEVRLLLDQDRRELAQAMRVATGRKD